MAARLAISGIQLDTGPGKPLTNGKINFFVNGTANDKNTFTDSGLGTPNPNPVILSATGVVPEIWSADSDIYAMQILDENDVVVLAVVQDITFLSAFTLSAADVLSALNVNTAAVVINGASMGGTSFAAFLAAFTLTAAGTINTAAGTITIGAIAGTPTFAGNVTHDADILAGSDSTHDIGKTAKRFLKLWVDSIAVTGGITVGATEDSGIADAFGNITATTTVDGKNIASVSSPSTGVFDVVFDNTASATAKQVVNATSGVSGLTCTSTNINATTVRIRQEVSNTGVADANVPIGIVRFLFS